MSIDDSVSLHRLWRETLTRLDALAERVNEGCDVLAAKDFAGFVHWSGLADYLERHATKEPLEVDGALLRARARALEVVCGELLSRNSPTSKIHETQLEGINRKLDLIAGHVAKLSPLLSDTAASDLALASPVLQVLEAAESAERLAC
jgi:hypothetical protein